MIKGFSLPIPDLMSRPYHIRKKNKKRKLAPLLGEIHGKKLTLCPETEPVDHFKFFCSLIRAGSGNPAWRDSNVQGYRERF